MTDYHLERRLRHAVHLDASVTRSDRTSCATLVTDLSLDGCCITGIYTLFERVEIKVRPIGILHGQIRWALAGKAGVRFAKGNETRRPAARLGPDARGVAAIEYALIMAFIAVVIVAAVANVGQGVRANFNEVDTAVPGNSGVGYNAG